MKSSRYVSVSRLLFYISLCLVQQRHASGTQQSYTQATVPEEQHHNCSKLCQNNKHITSPKSTILTLIHQHPDLSIIPLTFISLTYHETLESRLDPIPVLLRSTEGGHCT